MTTPNANPIPLFRPSKKRKVYRQRNHDDDFETGIEQSIPAPAPALTSAEQSLDELISSNSVPIKKEEEEEEAGIKDTLDMAEILRLRKQRRKIGGVEFRAESKIREENDTDSNGDTLVKFEEKDTEVVQPEGGLSMRRFAPQSGVVNSGVDKHIIETGT